MSSIFEPGDFQIYAVLSNIDRATIADLANAKLTSLGIDAGTVDALRTIIQTKDTIIAALEQAIAEAPRLRSNACVHLKGASKTLHECALVCLEARS